MNPLLLEMLLLWLRKTLRPCEAVVGHVGSISSPTALLMDFPSPQAAHTHGDLAWSTMILSPKLAIVETRTQASIWREEMTSTWEQEPGIAAEKLCPRPSQGQGGTFAQVSATSAQLAAVRARRGHAALAPSLQNPPTLQATISLPLQTTGPLMLWLPAFMAKASEACAIQLHMNNTESGLDTHQWKAIVDYEGAWTGKVLVQLANTQELLTLHARLHGQGVNIQHHTAGIEVDSLFVDLNTNTRSRNSGTGTTPQPM
jgi:hypothetical protein